MTDYSIDVLSDYIREELPTVIHESLPSVSPIHSKIKKSSQGVRQSEGIGRGWKVRHLYSTGLAGLMQSASPNGPEMQTNTEYDQSEVISGTGDVFPDAINSPHTSVLQRQLTLQMSTGNFSIPVNWLQAGKLPASNFDAVARDVREVGRMRALTEAISFFMSSDNALCQISSIDATNLADNGAYFEFSPKAGTGNIQFFRIGMMVDVYANDGGSPNFSGVGDSGRLNSKTGDDSLINLIVADVDYINGTVKVAAVNNQQGLEAGDLSGSAFANDDWIVLRNCGTSSGREMRTWGLEDWIASSGQILGGSADDDALDLDTYSQFKSVVQSVNGPLTEAVLNRYIGGFLNAYPGSNLDTILTTMGVTLKYLEQPSLNNNRQIFDRTGDALNVHGGWTDVKYSFQGRNMSWMISPMAISQHLYGLKLGNGNIRRYGPPKVGGSNNEVGGDVEFLTSVVNSGSIFKIRNSSSGQPTKILEAPFWQYDLTVPIDVRSVKLTDLTEADLG